MYRYRKMLRSNTTKRAIAKKPALPAKKMGSKVRLVKELWCARDGGNTCVILKVPGKRTHPGTPRHPNQPARGKIASIVRKGEGLVA